MEAFLDGTVPFIVPSEDGERGKEKPSPAASVREILRVSESTPPDRLQTPEMFGRLLKKSHLLRSNALSVVCCL